MTDVFAASAVAAAAAAAAFDDDESVKAEAAEAADSVADF